MHQTCAKAVSKTRPNQRNDTGTVPLEARGVKKQARTAPKRRRKGAKKELWPQRVAKMVPKKEPEVIKN